MEEASNWVERTLGLSSDVQRDVAATLAVVLVLSPRIEKVEEERPSPILRERRRSAS